MASSSSTPPKKYVVFLSFNGEDARTNVISHLYMALAGRKIKTYKDESLQVPQNVIEESKLAIIVFSKEYASSARCLDELVKIMECNSKGTQTVIPIFYNIDPSDIRNQTNSFAESFAEHALRFTDNWQKVQIWKRYLREAANLAGYHLSKGQRYDLAITKIVGEIFSKSPHLVGTRGLVGMKDRLKKLNSLLAEKPNGVCFLGIWGKGGVGKTVTARAIFNIHIGGFEGGCFLQDVYKKDMVYLQKSLLSQVLRADVNISDRYEGSSMIRTLLCVKRILVVLDGVNNLTQLEALAGDYSWFGLGSKIIITTRDVHLLNEAEAEANVIYEIETLSYSKAMKLFCWHAFKNSVPDESFVQLSDRVVRYASGLPLILVVLGSYLHGLRMSVWEISLARLEEDDPQDKVFDALKISFDELDDKQQEIFLDIACFFSEDQDHIDEVERMIKSFGIRYSNCITVLIDRSFIQKLDDGNIEMHDLIREMGRRIVRQKANNEPESYSRLWNRDDIIDVLMNNTGTIDNEGIVLKEEGCFMLSKEAFRNMNRLRLLKFYNHNFQGAPNYLPNSLRWLRWDNYPAKSLPESFKPTTLVSLELRDSSIIQTPDISAMLYLEVLDLSRCKKLLDVHPSVGDHKKLVHLNMSGCSVLEKFPKTIRMRSLEILNLHGCSAFKGFPEIHNSMRRLKILNLQDTNIERLPWSLGHLICLQEINLYGCKNLTSLPTLLCGLKVLSSITLSGCSKLEFFSENPSALKRKRRADDEDDKLDATTNLLSAFLSLPRLQELYMSYCNLSELIIPESIGCLTSLQELDIGGNDFISLPETIIRFSCLEVLNLERCKMLEELPELPLTIRKLFLNSCTALIRIPHLVDLLRRYKDLHHLSLLGCVQFLQKHEQTQTNAVGQSLPSFFTAFWDWQSVSDVLCTRREVLLIYLPEAELPDWLNQINTGRPDTPMFPGDQGRDDFPEDQDSDDSSEDQDSDDLQEDPDTAEFPEDQHTIFPPVTVTLSPSSWYNDELRGFALYAISKAFNLKVVTGNGRVINMPVITDIGDFGSDQTAFLYIPIDKLTSGTDLKTETEHPLFEVVCPLFEVINVGASKKRNDFGADTSWRIGLVYDKEGKGDIDISELPFTIHPYSSDGAKLKVCVLRS